jgi:CzcA family heavy metal efflux pump
MMRWIVGSSLRLRLLVVPVAAALLLLGFTQLRNLPMDVLPEFTPPLVDVQTEALGLSAAEVEQLVTVPLEQDLLNGVAFLDQIRSESLPGLSRIELIFEPGTDVLKARQLVQERLIQAPGGIPNVSKAPVMLQPLSSSSRVMMIGLSSKDLSLIDMSVLARWKIRPRLMGVPGVANVAIWGQRERQLQVRVDPAKLREHGVSLDQLIQTTGNALWVSPLSFVEASTPGTAGFIDTPNQRLGIQHILPITTAEDLSQVRVEDTGGKALRLGDVSRVVEDHQPLIGDAVVNDGPGLMLVIEKFPNTNTLEVTRGVEAALDGMRPGLSGITIDAGIFRPASFIEAATHNLSLALLIGLLLIVVLLGAFTFDWRVALVSLVTISLSLVTAALVLYARGATFNTMILAGLVVALGVIVDDAIVDIGNMKRRLGQRRKAREAGGETSGEAGGETTLATILHASLEVRGPLLYATLIIAVAAVPVFFLHGLTGSFFRPLAASYLLAVLASMVVALVVTPALAMLLASTSRAPLGGRQSPLARWLQRAHTAALTRLFLRPRLAWAAVGAIALAGLTVLPLLGGRSMLPSLQDRDLLIQWGGAAAVSQPEMDRITAQATRELRSVPGVRDVGAHVGRAITSDQIVNVNSGELWVSIDPKADYHRTVAAVRSVIAGYPGLVHNLVSYPEERIRQVQTGANDPLVVRVFGEDLQVLRAKAEEVRQALRGVDGVTSPHVDAQAVEPTVEIEVDLAAAQEHGIKPGDVRRSAAIQLSGVTVGNLFEEQKVFDVQVWSTPPTRHSLTSIENLPIDTPDGDQVPLGDVALVRLVPSPSVIKHDAVSRYIDVAAGIRGQSVGAVTDDVEQRLRSIRFPLEHHAEVLGAAAERRDAQQRALGVAVAAAIGILLLLQAAFGSWRLAALVFLTLPLALVGGALAAFVFTRGEITPLGTLAAFFTVLAVAVRNGVLLIKRYQRLQNEEGEEFGAGLVLRGTQERLSPIVLTALTVGLALLPVVLLGNIPGLEIVRPLAVVILGGLVTSTLVSLLIVPFLYLHFAPRSQPDTFGVDLRVDSVEGRQSG